MLTVHFKGCVEASEDKVIHCVPIISTLKVFLKHTDVLASILQQNNRENDDRLRTSQDGNS